MCLVEAEIRSEVVLCEYDRSRSAVGRVDGQGMWKSERGERERVLSEVCLTCVIPAHMTSTKGT